MLISELPNTPDYPLRALAELRRKENTDPAYGTQKTWNTGDAFEWYSTGETYSFWHGVFKAKRPPIPASSMEDLRRAGMMPEPVPKDFARVDTAPPPPFYCENSESTAGPCDKQCAECAVDERAAQRKPSITLSDYARMEREEEINDLIRTMLTPEELRGYYMGNIIKYRMRAGKKAFTGEDQSDDLFNARNFEGLLAELERG
jgi:hypothetical protein